MNAPAQLQTLAMGCTVHVNRHRTLTFRLYYEGREYWEGLGLADTANNRRLAEAQAVIISDEIRRRTFDYLKWFPRGNKAASFGAVGGAERLTLRQYYTRWIAGRRPPLVKKSAHRNYKAHFENHLLPLYGDRYIDGLGVQHIRELLTELLQKKRLTVKTAKNIVNATLRAALRDAVADQALARTPFDDLPANFWPRQATVEPDPFDEGERDAIIAYFRSKFGVKWRAAYVFVHALFWTGCRPSELTARRWRDLDPRTGKLSITSSRTEGEESATKTAASNRSIALFAPVLELVRELKPLRAGPADYIFRQRDGNPINAWKFGERYFQAALTALNIRPRAFYHTRHTFISVMLAHGENPKAIADYVGNSPEMIFKHYAKWLGATGTFGHAALAAGSGQKKKARER